MCCCHCLLVEALVEAEQTPQNQRAALQTSPGVATQTAGSVDWSPKRLCGWSMLPLLHRRRRATTERTAAL